MAILARAMVTLASIKDVASVTRFYKLLSSTASKPSAPTTNPPESSWSTTEPTYSEETTSTLYFVDLTVFSDGSYAYSDVSQSTSYEAAKSAYNVAQNAKDVADSAQDSIDNLKIGGRNLLYNSSFSKNFDKWARNVAYDMVVEDGYTCGHITGNDGACAINQNIIDRIKEDDSQQIYTISGDIKLVNYEDGSGTTDPYLAFYFSGHYDKNGVSTWTGVDGIGGNVQLNQKQFVPFNNQGWVRAYYTFKFTKSPSVMTDMKCDIFVRNWSGDLYFKNLKLERGNKATDWSPAPEDVDDNIAYSINNLSIGGRNLIRNTIDYKDWFVMKPEYISYPSDNEINYNATNLSSNAYTRAEGLIVENYEEMVSNNDYILSFEVMSPDWSNVAEVTGTSSGLNATCIQFVTFDTNTKAYFMKRLDNETFWSIIPTAENDKWLKFVSNPINFNDVNITWVDSSKGFGDFVRVGGQLRGNGNVTFRNFKLEHGNKVTAWSPAPEDFNEGIATISNNLSEYINSTEIVVGTQTAATGSWTGNAGFSELKDGQQIAYWLPYAGSGSASLNLTLSDGTTTGAKNVYYRGSTRANTHFVAGSLIHLTYRVNANVSGTNYTGWWADASYDSGNTYNRIRFENAVLAKTGISASRFIVGDDEGFFHLVGDSVFDITKPILWAASAISAGNTATTNYLAINSATLRNNLSSVTLSQYQTCYLVGNLTGKLFTVKSTEFFTSTIPTTDDGYYYISLGYLYSTYQIYLYPEHPIYKFVDGEFKNLNQVAYEANIKAIEAKDDIDSLSFGGRNLLFNSSFSKNFDEWTNQGTTPNDYYEIVTEDGYKCAHATCGFGVYRNKRQNITNRIKDDNIENTVYTVSFDMKLVNYVAGSTNPYLKVYFTGNYINSSGQSKALYATYQNEDPDLAPYNNMGWVRVIVSNIKFEQQPSNMNFTIYSRDWEGDLYYKNLKLERGNKATDWSPAPEDIDESINSVTIESTSDNFINYTFDGSKIYYPSTITLTPFINGNIEFSKWQYKLINGDTWIDVVSGSNGLTVESDNTLTISNSCSLFTDTCSAIVFKCLSDNNTFYSYKTIVREDDPTRVYNTVKTRVDQTDDNLSLIASATELAEYSTSSTLNSRLANVSVSSDEILMVVSQSVNNLSTANGIKGVYDETVSYATNNIVVLNGKFYKAQKASTGKTPPNATYWTDVTSQYSETTLKTAFSKIVALQDSITLQVSGSNGNSTINLTDGTLSLTVTDVANILANKELNLTSENGVINIYGGGGVNIGTNNLGALNIQSPNFKLTDSGYIISSRGLIGNWEINENVLSSFKIFENGQPLNFPNSWISGYHYRVGDHVIFYDFNDGYTDYSYISGTCIKDHISNASNVKMSEYWDTGEGIVNEVTIDGIVCTTVIDSYNSKITLDKIDVGDLDSEISGHTTIEAGNILVDDISIKKYKIRCNNANNDLTIESQNDIVLNNAKIGNVSISSIGDGSITGAISTLNTNKSNALSKATYNAADETIPTSEMKEFSINIASSGKEAIGIIGCVALGSASACLCGFWLDNNTTAKVRIRNISNTSIVCHPRVIILYVDN